MEQSLLFNLAANSSVSALKKGFSKELFEYSTKLRESWALFLPVKDELYNSQIRLLEFLHNILTLNSLFFKKPGRAVETLEEMKLSTTKLSKAYDDLVSYHPKGLFSEEIMAKHNVKAKELDFQAKDKIAECQSIAWNINDEMLKTCGLLQNNVESKDNVIKSLVTQKNDASSVKNLTPVELPKRKIQNNKSDAVPSKKRKLKPRKSSSRYYVPPSRKVISNQKNQLQQGTSTETPKSKEKKLKIPGTELFLSSTAVETMRKYLEKGCNFILLKNGTQYIKLYAEKFYELIGEPVPAHVKVQIQKNLNIPKANQSLPKEELSTDSNPNSESTLLQQPEIVEVKTEIKQEPLESFDDTMDDVKYNFKDEWLSTSNSLKIKKEVELHIND